LFREGGREGGRKERRRREEREERSGGGVGVGGDIKRTVLIEEKMLSICS
jgi:hypothetical protein